LAIQINQIATQALSQMDDAEDAIVNALNEGRTLGLNEAQDLLNQANSEYSNGNYAQALNLATRAATKAEEAEAPLSAEDETS
jgi:cellobiose-specific phosphotransferase system component IIA